MAGSRAAAAAARPRSASARWRRLTRAPATGRRARPAATERSGHAQRDAGPSSSGGSAPIAMPTRVQQSRRGHEADAVGEAARARRAARCRARGRGRPRRTPTSDRRGPERRPPLGEHREPEQHARERDADLDAGQRHAERARACRRTPSPSGRSPAAATPPARRAARPTGRRRPSPARGRGRRRGWRRPGEEALGARRLGVRPGERGQRARRASRTRTPTPR